MMISRECMATLQTATQDILDNTKDFPRDIAPLIEDVAQAAPDEWSRARLRKLPVVAAFSHAIASHAIARIEKGSIAPEGENAYEKYLSLTEKIDEAAGQQAIAELRKIGGTFTDAAAYFKAQVEIMNDVAENTPDIIQRHGKIAYTVDLDPPDVEFKLLANPMVVNARGTTMSVIIGQVIRICLREKCLPEAEEISRELNQNAVHLTGLTQQPAAVFHHSVASKSVAQKILREIRTKNKATLSTTAWPAIVHAAITTGRLDSAARELSQPPHTPSPNSHKLGHCAAQLYLRSYEHPAHPGENKILATRYFEKRRLKLLKGAFRTADYQVLHAIEAAEVTLFSDPESRIALEALAQYAQSKA